MSIKEANHVPTHTFTLLTGIECEVQEMTGKHQRILTQKGNKDFTNNLVEMLADLIVRIGNNVDVTVEDVDNMLSADRKKALLEARQFSLGFPDTFEFTHEYTSESGAKKEEPMEVSIAEITQKGYKQLQGSELVDVVCTEYSQVPKVIYFELPRSKKQCRLFLLDGLGEKRLAAIKSSQLSANSILECRSPQESFKDSAGKDVWTSINLDRTSLLDMEYMRKLVKDVEGSLDTVFIFDHPEASSKVGEEKEIRVDLLNLLAFFFPSEAI